MKFSILKALPLNNLDPVGLTPLFALRLLYSIPTLISLPFLVKTVGTESWTKFAVAQVIGAGLGIFVEAQWKNTGIKNVVKIEEKSLRTLIWSEYIKKLNLLVVTVAPMVVLTWILVDSATIDIFLAVFASSTTSLSMELSLTSRKNFSLRIWIEPIFRIIICISGMNLFKSAETISYFFIMLIIGNFILPLTTITANRNFLRQLRLIKFDKNDLIYAIGRVLAASYTIFPIIILSNLNIENFFIYAVIDKLFRFAMTFYIPLFQFIQVNVHEDTHGIMIKRKSYIKVTGISSILLTFIIIYILQLIMLDLRLEIIISTLVGFTLLSAVINMNRFSEILLTEITSNSLVQSRILTHSTFLFWGIFGLVIWIQNYFVSIIACIFVEIFGLILRARLIDKLVSKKNLND